MNQSTLFNQKNPKINQTSTNENGWNKQLNQEQRKTERFRIWVIIFKGIDYKLNDDHQYTRDILRRETIIRYEVGWKMTYHTLIKLDKEIVTSETLD